MDGSTYDPAVFVLAAVIMLPMLWVCSQKGRLGWGLLGLVIPFLLIGAAITLAPPDSAWAKSRCTGEKLERARKKYPNRAA